MKFNTLVFCIPLEMSNEPDKLITKFIETNKKGLISLFAKKYKTIYYRRVK